MSEKERNNGAAKPGSPASQLARATRDRASGASTGIPSRGGNQARIPLPKPETAPIKGDLPTSVKRLLWGLVTAALVAPAFIFGKQIRGEPWDWAEAAGASAVMFVVFLFLAKIRDYQK
jgi:hypothetical protein